MRYLYLLMCCLLFTTRMAVAFECYASTNVRELELSGREVVSEKLSDEEGTYEASFTSGDVVVAKFRMCSLGMRATYYSKVALNDSARRERLRWMLRAVLPSAERHEMLKSELGGTSVPDDDAVIVVGDSIDNHEFVFKVSDKPGYKIMLNYTWVPPEY